MKTLHAWLDRHRDVPLLLVRLWAGGAMALLHGLGKVSDLGGFTAKVGAMGFPMPGVLGPAAALSEFVGGVLIAIGLATRGASLMLLLTMLNAAFVVHAADPVSKREPALLYAALSLALLVVGPGRYSLDKRLGWER